MEEYEFKLPRRATADKAYIIQDRWYDRICQEELRVTVNYVYEDINGIYKIRNIPLCWRFRYCYRYCKQIANSTGEPVTLYSLNYRNTVIYKRIIRPDK